MVEYLSLIYPHKKRQEEKHREMLEAISSRNHTETIVINNARRNNMPDNSNFRTEAIRSLKAVNTPFNEYKSSSTEQLKIVKPPSLPHSQKVFYMLINDAQYGPYNIAQLSQMQKSGQLTLNTLIWTEGMEQWTEIHYCPELSTIFDVENNGNNYKTMNNNKIEISYQDWKSENPGKTINEYYAAKKYKKN